MSFRARSNHSFPAAALLPLAAYLLAAGCAQAYKEPPSVKDAPASAQSSSSSDSAQTPSGRK